jgi:hypothetical protein
VADGTMPDLCIENLRKLRAGMTTDEVEVILGPYMRPNVRHGRKFFAWIAEGAMLRARFDGPGETLTTAVVDWALKQQVLELGQ